MVVIDTGGSECLKVQSKDCKKIGNWTELTKVATAGCMVLGEVHRVVQDQLQLVAIETGLYRGRGIFCMKTKVFVDILYAKNTDK